MAVSFRMEKRKYFFTKCIICEIYCLSMWWWSLVWMTFNRGLAKFMEDKLSMATSQDGCVLPPDSEACWPWKEVAEEQWWERSLPFSCLWASQRKLIGHCGKLGLMGLFTDPTGLSAVHVIRKKVSDLQIFSTPNLSDVLTVAAVRSWARDRKSLRDKTHTKHMLTHTQRFQALKSENAEHDFS